MLYCTQLLGMALDGHSIANTTSAKFNSSRGQSKVLLN